MKWNLSGMDLDRAKKIKMGKTLFGNYVEIEYFEKGERKLKKKLNHRRYKK